MGKKFLLSYCLVVLLTASAPVLAQDGGAFDNSGLPIPRFVSLRSDKVFVRSGPGLRYPIQWIFQREGLPVEVIQEFDTWRKIRDYEGQEGWIHQSLLAGKRTAIVRADSVVDIYAKPAESSRLTARFEPNVIAEVEACAAAWCQIEAGGFEGWSLKKNLWGVYAEEELE